MIDQYVIPAGAALLLVTGGYGWFERQRAQTLELEMQSARSELATCAGRLANVLEDTESDRGIDALPDSALVDVPDHWLRP